LNNYTFHTNLYDPVFLGAIFIGLTFTLLLWFTKRINLAASRFLGLALATIVLWMAWVLGIDIRLDTYFPRWSWLPLQFSLTLGPLIFFYVLKITRPEYKFRWKDLLHFSPLLLEQGVLVLQVKESIKTGAATYNTELISIFLAQKFDDEKEGDQEVIAVLYGGSYSNYKAALKKWSLIADHPVIQIANHCRF
jgi:hypothetical protein